MEDITFCNLSAVDALSVRSVCSKDGEIHVEHLVKGGAAEVGGVVLDDILQAINGIDITGKPLHEVAAMLPGTEGSPVSLVLLRGSIRETVMLHLTRTIQIHIDSGASTPTRASSNQTFEVSDLTALQAPQAGVGIMLQVINLSYNAFNRT